MEGRLAVHARHILRSEAPGLRVHRSSLGSRRRTADASASSSANGTRSHTPRGWRRSRTSSRWRARAGPCSSSRNALSWLVLAHAPIALRTPTTQISCGRAERRTSSSAPWTVCAGAGSSRSCLRAFRKSQSCVSGTQPSLCVSLRSNVDPRQQRPRHTGGCEGCRRSREANFRACCGPAESFVILRTWRVCARPAPDSDPVRRQGPERGSTGGGGRPRSFPSGPPLRGGPEGVTAGRQSRPASYGRHRKRCLSGPPLRGGPEGVTAGRQSRPASYGRHRKRCLSGPPLRTSEVLRAARCKAARRTAACALRKLGHLDSRYG